MALLTCFSCVVAAAGARTKSPPTKSQPTPLHSRLQGTPTFFVRKCLDCDSDPDLDYLKIQEHPSRVEDEGSATFSFACCLNAENAGDFILLPKRSPEKPYLIWSHKLNIVGEDCMLTTGCASAERLIATRKDFLYINFDLRDHVLTNDDAKPLIGVTIAPPNFYKGPRINFESSPKFFLTFRGTLNDGFMWSSTARSDLQKGFENVKRADVVMEFLPELSKIGPADVTRFNDLMDTAYALVPHGDGRWNYRFSEVVGACAIPVVMADGVTWPYEQLIDWSQAGVQLQERLAKSPEMLQLARLNSTQRRLQAHDAMVDLLAHPEALLSQLPKDPEVIRRMRRKVCEINDKYFATPEKRWTAMLRSAAVQVR